MQLFREYVKVSVRSPDSVVSPEQKRQLRAELSEYEKDHSAIYDKPEKKPMPKPADDSEVDGNGSFLCERSRIVLPDTA